jgi:peptidoglycan/LPS O-acetylase OafA/YrhL
MAAKPIVPSLTGLRFYAAGFIVWTHTAESFAAVSPTSNAGYIGMTLFFVLSGFVIHYNYGDSLASLRPGAIWDFLVARFARLYPLYLMGLLLSLAMLESWPLSDPKFWFALPYYLTLTQDWFPITVDNRLLTVLYLGAAWSISAEVMLYLFYFVLAWPMRWLRTTPAVIAAIAALFVVASAITYSRANGWAFVTMPPRWPYYLSPYCRIPEFVLGALTAALFLARQHMPASNREWLL